MTLETRIHTNWPAKSGEYKLVQLEMDGKNYLGFGENGESHAIILTNLLEKEGNRWTRAYGGKYSFCRDKRLPDDFEGKEYNRVTDPSTPDSTLEVTALIPALLGQDYKVVGMGKAVVNEEKKIAIINGKSTSYGIGVECSWIELIKEANPDWTLESRSLT
ncbi:MAG: hypothetical protein Q7K43_03120 [Candidatus Woesearchaeota archaeon]|nr:hypothetical protein [Candidatus Woesearchaeota archaeon]